MLGIWGHLKRRPGLERHSDSLSRVPILTVLDIFTSSPADLLTLE